MCVVEPAVFILCIAKLPWGCDLTSFYSLLCFQWFRMVCVIFLWNEVHLKLGELRLLNLWADSGDDCAFRRGRLSHSRRPAFWTLMIQSIISVVLWFCHFIIFFMRTVPKIWKPAALSYKIYYELNCSWFIFWEFSPWENRHHHLLGERLSKVSEGLEGQDSSALVALVEDSVWFPTPTRCLTAIHISSSRRFDPLFCPLQTLHTWYADIHTGQTLLHIK